MQTSIFHLPDGTLMTDEWDPGDRVVQSQPPHLMHIETRAQGRQEIPRGTHRTKLDCLVQSSLFYQHLFCEIFLHHHSDSKTVTGTQ